jgi:hypothetical protein
MYQVERLKMHYASKMWDMASKEIVTSFLWWAILANCTQLEDKCMSILELIFPHGILTWLGGRMHWSSQIYAQST